MIQEGIGEVYRFMRKRAPAILTGVSITSFLLGTVKAVQARPEADRRLEAKREELGRPLTTVEKIRTAGPVYLPAAVLELTGTVSALKSNSLHNEREDALAAAAMMATSRVRELNDKIEEELGKKKKEKILDAVDRDEVEKNPPPANMVTGAEEITAAGGIGQTLCYDSMFGRYFWGDIEKIKRAVNKLNRQMTTGFEPFISLNEFYMEIDLETVEAGDKLGWNVSRGLIDVRFSSQLAGGRTPCLVIGYEVPPEYNYRDY